MTLLVDTTLDFQNVNDINNLPDPTLAQQPATKHYVDGIAQGVAYLDAVQASTNEDVSIASPGAIGSASAGERVLLTGQTTASQNGVYEFNGNTSALTRTTDYATGATIEPGTATFDEGSSTLFVMNETASIIVDTNASTWTTGSSTSLSFDAPLTQSGSVVSLNGGDPLPVTDGGTGASTAGGARTALSATGKYATTVGDGSDTSFVVTHNLGTTDVTVNVYDMATGNLELTQVSVTGVNTVSVTFGSAPADAGGTIGSGTGKRVVVVG